MPYRGAFMAGAVVSVMPNPQPDARHAEHTFPDNDWSRPPATKAEVSGSYDEAVDPPMTGRGIVLDLGHRFGHDGTDLTSHARARFVGPESQGVAQDAAARAHGDSRAAYFTPHTYTPIRLPFAGESYGVDRAEGAPGRPTSGRVITKTHTGGEFSDGPTDASYTPTGYRLGVTRRWAERHYSSPLLGAMYSTNALRGVIPQTVAVPVDQPASGRIRNSGLSSQQRQLLNYVTVPALFRTPPSASDQQIAAQQPAPVVGPVI